MRPRAFWSPLPPFGKNPPSAAVARAIYVLGSDKLEVRLGRIYALERMAKRSEADYWPIMETLAAYVRRHAIWKRPDPRQPEPARPPQPKPAPDIQAIMTVLGQRPHNCGGHDDKLLDLSGVDLRGTNLAGAHLERAFLIGAHLEGADFTKARLENACAVEAHLEGAYLVGAHLEGANLAKAHLEGADLSWAQVEGTNITEAHLEGADLRRVIGLQPEQMASAMLNGKTRLPEGTHAWNLPQPARRDGATPKGSAPNGSAPSGSSGGSSMDARPRSPLIRAAGGALSR